MTEKIVKISHRMFHLFAPIFYLNRFACLLPLKWKKFESKYFVTKSRKYVAYSFITNIFVVILGMYGMSESLKIKSINSIRLASGARKIVNFSDIAVIFGTTSIGVIVTCLKIEKIIYYFQRLTKFDHLLEQEAPEAWKFSIVVIPTIILSMVVFTFDMHAWILVGSYCEKPEVIFGWVLPLYISYFGIFLMELMYWCLVYSIKIRIVTLNLKLKELHDSRIENRIKLVNSRHKLIKAKQVRDLIRAYEYLTEAADLVNDFYGFIILIIFLGCFIHLLTSPYVLRMTILAKLHIATTEQSIWIFLHIFRLILVVEPCHGCLVESRKTSNMVCKLLLADFDEGIRKYLDVFVVYLAQNKIEFTVFGFTAIHRGLLSTIAGAIITYLVILFQFN